MNSKKIITFSVIIIICISSVYAAYILTQQKETKIDIICNSSMKIGDNIEFKLTTENGEPLYNKTLNIILIDSDGEKNSLKLNTDENGIATFMLNSISSGNCNIKCIFNESDRYSSSNKTTTIYIEEIAQQDYSKTESSSNNAGTPININGDTSGKQYYIVEYNFNGDPELGLVKDSYGNYYIYAGDGLHPYEEWNNQYY